mgnify:CR=1 FL=1
MKLHPSTFGYLLPTDMQKMTMHQARQAATDYARILDVLVPDGPDKTVIMRKFREVAMWVNVAITRHADGSPRTDTEGAGEPHG